MRAFCLIRSEPHYRSDAFVAGLKACGFEVVTSQNVGTPKRDDLLVIWNRYGVGAVLAERFEAVGAVTIVAENGIVGASENAYAKQFASPGMEPETQLYSLALNYHNGGGSWWIGEPGRWRAQGIVPKPWRDDGEHILVLPQRGFGHPKVAPPTAWTETTVAKLKKLTHRPIRVRAHPGNFPAKTPLTDDLRDAWCAVCWGSGAGVKSICAGIPCYSDWPSWLGHPGALPLSLIGRDILPSDKMREVMLDRLSWCQWEVREISGGEPFKRLLEVHKEQREAA